MADFRPWIDGSTWPSAAPGWDCGTASPATRPTTRSRLPGTWSRCTPPTRPRVYLSAWARLRDPAVEAVERALYEDRSLIRMLGMRRTMFVVPVETAPVVQAGATEAVALVQRRLFLKHLAEAGLGEEAWLKEVEESTLRALAARGSATAAQLAADEPRLRSQLLVAEGKDYAAVQNITSRVLNLLSQQGRIVRGRPRGTWISTQYHWSPVETWLPGGLTGLIAEEARAALAERWLAAYGPATPADLKWWTGWTGGQVKAALAALDTVAVDLDGTPGVLLARRRRAGRPRPGRGWRCCPPSTPR